MTKESQTWGYWAPAHDAKAAKEYHNEASGSLSAPLNLYTTLQFRPVTAAAGALVGLWNGARHADKKHGFKSLTSWKRFKDSMHDLGQGFVVGAKAGWGVGDQLPRVVATTGANIASDFGLMSDETQNNVNKWNESKMLEHIKHEGIVVPPEPPVDPETGRLLPTGDPKYRLYDNYVNWNSWGLGTARVAGDAAAALALGTAAAKVPGLSKAPGMTKALVTGLSPAPKRIIRGHASTVKANEAENAAIIAKQLFDLSRLNPSSAEYQKLYNVMNGMVKDGIIPKDALEGFASPVVPKNNSGPAFRMSPTWQNAIGWGLGGAGTGALLGALVGGKKASWKMALLGLLLGSAYGGREGLMSMWDSIGSWKK